jgi:DNA-binding PadR family transcriptional regulator
VVKFVSDLSLLGIDLEDNSAHILLDKVLTQADVSIIDVVARLRHDLGKAPTASDIQEELLKSYQLRKTQLYERLKRLARLGFLSVNQLPRPRRYIANRNTITQGVERWVEEQRESIANLSSELETLHNFLERMNTTSFASLIAEKLSMDFGSS